MNERLEEIMRDKALSNDDAVIKNKDYEWLIEQAERVKVLEEIIESRKETINNYKEACKSWEVINQYDRQQNKRYRDGLTKLYKSICKGGKYDGRINRQVAFNIIMDIEKIDEGLRDELNKALESVSE